MLFMQLLINIHENIKKWCSDVVCAWITGQVQDPDTRECLDCGIGCKTCSTGK